MSDRSSKPPSTAGARTIIGAFMDGLGAMASFGLPAVAAPRARTSVGEALHHDWIRVGGRMRGVMDQERRRLGGVQVDRSRPKADP